jgi:hypothetical protein
MIMEILEKINMKLKVKQWLGNIAEFYYIDKYGNYGITNEIELDAKPKPDKQLRERQMLAELGRDTEVRKYIFSLLENSDSRRKYFLPIRKGAGQINDTMILHAKEYPIENLIEFDSRNTAECIFGTHDNARMSKPRDKNFVKCFACDRSADSIEVYKIIKGVDFKTAVKNLQ